MPVVDIKGVGKAKFPDEMMTNDIRTFLRQKYSPELSRQDALTPRPATMQASNPSLATRAAQGIGEGLNRAGIISDRFGAQQIGKNVTSIGEFLPVIGDATAGDEFGRALKQGDNFAMAMGALGAIPLVGDAAKKGAGKIGKLYHGSAYKFDEFDIDSNYMTGEGGGGFGYGLHLSGSKRTADNYAYNREIPSIGGVLYDDGRNPMQPMAVDILKNGYEKTFKDISDTAIANPDSAFVKRKLEAIKKMKGKEILDKGTKGIIYDVDIPEKTKESLIDFNSNMTSQSNITSILDENDIDYNINGSGEDLYYELSESLGGDMEASQLLDSVGIKGIRYPDTLEESYSGTPSYNYTIFNSEDAKINN
jgi:hypothetical protein